jgi:hypothetical protein
MDCRLWRLRQEEGMAARVELAASAQRRGGVLVVALLMATGCATEELAMRGRAPPGPATCGGQAAPEGWPDFSTSDEELLAPFQRCASPGEFLELQRGVDMPRLVEALGDWSAVRLGALGPLRGGADILTRKRAAFLMRAAHEYSMAEAEVFALFVVHASFNNEVKELLVLLGQDKRLGQTLGRMPAVREALVEEGEEGPLIAW